MRRPQLLVFMMMLLGSHMASVCDSRQSEGPVVVTIDRDERGATYRVDSRQVPFRSLLDTLDRMLASSRPSGHLVLLVHEDTSIRSVMDVKVLATKVGYEEVAIFYFDATRRSMQELSFASKVLPFAEKGPSPE